jgi:hypothetical protein
LQKYDRPYLNGVSPDPIALSAPILPVFPQLLGLCFGGHPKTRDY